MNTHANFKLYNAKIVGGRLRSLPHSFLPPSLYRLFWPVVHAANERVQGSRTLDAGGRSGLAPELRYSKWEALASVALDVHAGRTVSVRKYAYLWNVPASTAQGWLRKLAALMRRLVAWCERVFPDFGEDWKAVSLTSYTKAVKLPAADIEQTRRIYARWDGAHDFSNKLIRTHLLSLRKRIQKNWSRLKLARQRNSKKLDVPQAERRIFSAIKPGVANPKHISKGAKLSISTYFNAQTALRV